MSDFWILVIVVYVLGFVVQAIIGAISFTNPNSWMSRKTYDEERKYYAKMTLLSPLWPLYVTYLLTVGVICLLKAAFADTNEKA